MYPCKIWVFWKCCKIFETHLNRILNSGKDRFWAFYLFFKNLENSIKTILIYLKFSCHTCFFSCLWNMEKMNFCWYLPKKRPKKIFDVWKKKPMISSDSHLKSYLNLTKSREKNRLFKVYDFLFRVTVKDCPGASFPDPHSFFFLYRTRFVHQNF